MYVIQISLGPTAYVLMTPRFCRRLGQDDEASETLPDIAQLDAKIAEAEEAMAKAETAAEKRKAKERREDLMRLKRVEQIYVRSISSLGPRAPRH